MHLLHVTSILPTPGKEFIPPEAMYRGRYVHQVTALLDDGKTLADPIHEPWRGYVEAWERCKRELRIFVLASEEPVEDKARGYCGTLDKRVMMYGRRGEGILDLKCSGSGAVPPTTGLQIAGYCGESRFWRGAVALMADGSYRFYDDRADTDLFRTTDWKEFCSRLFVMQMDIRRGWREAPPERKDEQGA